MTVSSILKRLDYIATLYDPTNSYALEAVYNNFYSMYYRKILNGPGLLTIVVPDDHDIVQYLQDDLLVKLHWWRATPIRSAASSTSTESTAAISLPPINMEIDITCFNSLARPKF